MKRFFLMGYRMVKVGSVAHQQFGQGRPQYVGAEDYDALLEERNVLEATLHDVCGREGRTRVLVVLSGYLNVALLLALTWAVFP